MKIYDQLSQESDIKVQDPAPRPPPTPYRLSNLAYASRSLFRPNSRTSDVESAVGLSEMTAGKVRELGRVRLCDLKLEDVLQNKHTPPLTLKDFEAYLCFVERSAENLYFELWIDNFKKHVAKVDRSSPSSVNGCADLYKLGLDTFFSQTSPLELNIRSENRRKVDEAVNQLEADIVAGRPVDPFLGPTAFDRAFAETHESLLGSFQSFLRYQTRNAHHKRGYFAMFLGSLTFLLGLLPTIIGTQLHAARAWRVLGLPFFFLGIVVLVGGLKRTCLVAFLLGSASRQLYPWELAREHDALSSFGSDTMSSDAFSSHVDEKGSPNMNGASTPGTLSRTSSYPSLNYWPVPRSPSFDSDRSPRAPSSVQSPNPSSTKPLNEKAGEADAKLYFAPSYIVSRLPWSSDVWAPLTPIIDPIIKRNVRDNIVAAAGYGLLATILTGAICLAVPNAK